MSETAVKPVFTRKQREELHRRLKYAICWRISSHNQDQASNTATLVLDELAHIHSSAALGRRAVVAIVDKMERSA